MTDDWQWFWAGEGGRDRILRDEIGGLQAQLSSASAQSHRLSSQLASLSGSLESRLNALSRAFDAYVELGDVREELAAFDEPADVRREVMGAVESLAGGRSAARVDARDLDYWLPHAMNAVSALAAGEAASEDLERARALAPETDLFVVAAAGALGHGEAVAHLLADVLTADETLTTPQQTVWRAATDGAYGAELPEALSAAWRPQLDREPAAGWSAWVGGHGSTPSAGISWLRQLVAEPAGPDSGTLAPTPSAVDGLRAVVVELIQRGLPAEQELLRRSRELRAQIEHPGGAAPSPEADAPATVVSEARYALQSATTTPRIRATLRAWVAPALLTVVDELTAAAAAAPPAQETVRGHGTLVTVTSAGADEVALQSAEARLLEAYAVSTTPVIGWSVGTGIAAVLTVVLGILGSGWAWLCAIALLVGVIGTVRQVRSGQQTRRTGSEAVRSLRDDLAETVARLDAVEQRRTAMLVQLDGEAVELRRLLGATVAAGPTEAVGAQPRS